jgi:hypothetical protein
MRKQPKESPEVRALTTRLPADLIRRLKMHAAATSGQVQEIVATALEVYLKTHAKEGQR